MSTKSRILVCILSFIVLAAGLALLTIIQNIQKSQNNRMLPQDGMQSMPVKLKDGRNAYVLLPTDTELKQGMSLSVPVLLEDGTVTTGTMRVNSKTVEQHSAQHTDNNIMTSGQAAMRDPAIAAMVAKGKELGFQGKPIKTVLEDGSVLVAWVDDPGNIKKGMQAPAVLPDLTPVMVELELTGNPSDIVVLEP